MSIFVRRFPIEYKRKIVKVTKTVDDSLKRGTPCLVSFYVNQAFQGRAILGRFFMESNSGDRNISSCGNDEGTGA